MVNGEITERSSRAGGSRTGGERVCGAAVPLMDRSTPKSPAQALKELRLILQSVLVCVCVRKMCVRSVKPSAVESG